MENTQDKKNMIKAVSNNQEKGLSYKENLKRYKKAKTSEFYLECLWILYAMLEDRTSSFLYYLGFTSDKKRNSVTGTKGIKTQIRQIFGMPEKGGKYKFYNISGKLTRIIEVICWSVDVSDELTDYQKAVKKSVRPLAAEEELIKMLEYLNDEWRDKRNQLTHSLFNKDPNAVILELVPLIEGGYKGVRILDKAVSQLKSSNIRKKFKIQ